MNQQKMAIRSLENLATCTNYSSSKSAKSFNRQILQAENDCIRKINLSKFLMQIRAQMLIIKIIPTGQNQQKIYYSRKKCTDETIVTLESSMCRTVISHYSFVIYNKYHKFCSSELLPP